MQKRSNNYNLLLLIILIFFSFSCSKSELLGKYKIDKVRGYPTDPKSLEEINLLKGDKVVLRYTDTLILGTWKEHLGIDYHYIHIFANNEAKNLEVFENIINDSSVKLYFIGNPTDFRGGEYDSLSFIKVK